MNLKKNLREKTVIWQGESKSAYLGMRLDSLGANNFVLCGGHVLYTSCAEIFTEKKFVCE